jgi:hypothetical protein
MATKTFEADLARFSDLAIEDIMACIKASTQDVLSDAQTPVDKGGNLPVDTGYLRNSLITELVGGTSFLGAASYTAVLAGWQPGQELQSGWIAEYALRIEFGFRGVDSKGRKYNQKPRYYLRQAVSKWNKHMRKNATLLSRTT